MHPPNRGEKPHLRSRKPVVVAGLERIPGDLLIILSDAQFISYTAYRFFPLSDGERIRLLTLYPRDWAGQSRN